MMWPFSPLAPTVERLSFLTNVMETPLGERRVSVRGARSEFDHRYLFDEEMDARAYHLFRSNPLGEWQVPVWTEYTHFDTPLVAGSNCYMPNGLGGSRRFKGLTERACSFVTFDQRSPAASPFSTLSGLDVVTDPTVTVAPLVDTLYQAATYIDNGSGLVTIEPQRDFIEGMAGLSFLDKTPAERWRRKRWFHHVRGKEKAFWVPSWTRDYTLSIPIISAAVTLDILPLPGDPESLIGRGVAIYGSNTHYRVIQDAFETSGIWRLAFSGSLGETIPISAQVSRLGKYRLDTDEIELSQLGEVVSDVTLACKEVVA